MIQTTTEYIGRLINGIPYYVYGGLVSVFCICMVASITLYGWEKGLKQTLVALYVDYIFFVYCSTVIYRNASDVTGLDLTPFRTYTLYKSGSDFFLLEAILNVVVFSPIGFLGSYVFRSWQWWKVWFLGVAFSVSIETLQFFFQRGFCEFDDVMANSLGCLTGIGISQCFSKMYVQRMCDSDNGDNNKYTRRN